LYPLKKKNPIVKPLLATIWGALAQRKKIYHHNEVDFDSLEQLNNTMNTGNCFVEKTKKYVLPHARFGVFITAFARNALCNEIADIVDSISRIHTDSILTTSNKVFKISDKLGEWKEERSGTFVVENMRKPILL
jgi:hypothetical protein